MTSAEAAFIYLYKYSLLATRYERQNKELLDKNCVSGQDAVRYSNNSVNGKSGRAVSHLLRTKQDVLNLNL